MSAFVSAVAVIGNTCSQLHGQEGCGQILRGWKLATGSQAGGSVLVIKPRPWVPGLKCAASLSFAISVALCTKGWVRPLPAWSQAREFACLGRKDLFAVGI